MQCFTNVYPTGQKFFLGIFQTEMEAMLSQGVFIDMISLCSSGFDGRSNGFGCRHNPVTKLNRSMSVDLASNDWVSQLSGCFN